MQKWYHDVGLLVLRVLTGCFIATHGYGKIFTDGRMEKFAEGVAEMGFPVPIVFAWAAALSELVGGLLMAAGLFTRYAAFLVFSTMTVAAFIRHADDPFSMKEKALLFWTISLAIMLMGAGRYALDRLIAKK